MLVRRRRAPLGVPVDEPEAAGEPAQAGQRDVRRDRLRHREPELAAILGDVGDASGHGVTRRPDLDVPLAAPDLPRVCRPDAEERLGDLGASGSDEPGEAEHLALADLERDVVERALATEPVHPEGDRTELGPRPLEEVGEVAADHVPDERGLGHVDGRPGRDVPAVAEHRDPIAELEHLVQAMADEEDGDTVGGQTPHLTEEALDLVRRQRRRRLVHDQHAHVAGHRLGDLDGLLGADGQLRRHRSRIEVDLQLAQDRRRPPVHVTPADEPAAAGGAHEDVLRHREVGEHQRLLVDAGDAQPLGVGGAAQLDDVAVHRQVTAVRSVETGHHLDQRRLAGAVLPDEGMDLARAEIERHAGQRPGRAEGLRHVDDRQQ